MRTIDCVQGSAEWYSARLGIPTASNFERIVTPTGKLSAQARKYAYRLSVEKLLNRSLDDISSLDWVSRGRELEPSAVKLFEFERGVRTRPVGFLLSDDGRFGASPDRLVDGENAGLEIKCCAPQTHFGYLVDGFGLDHFVQAQGQIFVGGFDLVYRYAYHPELPPVLDRTYRDDAFQVQLRSALVSFVEMLDEMSERARAAGVIQSSAHVVTPADAAYGDASYGDAADDASLLRAAVA